MSVLAHVSTLSIVAVLAVTSMPDTPQSTVATPDRPIASPALADRPVVLMGDSDAHSWKLERLTSIRVINKGHPGDRTADMLKRFQRDVIDERPRAVIIFGLENDLFDPPAGGYERASEDVRANYTRMTEVALQNGIEPILATQPTEGHRPGAYAAVKRTIDGLISRPSYEDRLNAQILPLNDWLRQYARTKGLLLLDLQPLVSDRDQYRIPEYAAPDGSHISEQGYAVLTKYVEPVLRAHFAPSTTRPTR